MSDILTAEDFLNKHCTISHFYDDKTEQMVVPSSQQEQAMIEFAKLHVEAALKAVSENATVDIIDHEKYKVLHLPGYERGTKEVILPIYGVDEDSILNAYPLTNIK